VAGAVGILASEVDLAIKIVADSTCDLTPDMAQDLGVTIVPLHVIFGDASYRDGIDITAEEFYEMLVKSRQLPTTSAPSVGDFQEVYTRLLDEGHSVVSIHLSGKLSATVRMAQAAADSLKQPGRIAVVDSQSVSLGIGFAIMEAAAAARAGASLEEARAAAESIPRRLYILFMVDTLEYLRRGGRIGRARAYLGTILKIKPILSIREGELFPVERVRTRSQGVERIIQAAVRHQNVKMAAVAHSTTPDEAELIRGRLAVAFPHAQVFVARFTPVLGTHGGPGVVGIGVVEGH
jgi:fatty acid kinase fatty acid binding subunit